MDVTEITEDGFLDGRLRTWQFRRGFRSGLDAVMLAAAVPATGGDTVLELGSGAGVASLCLAVRVPACTIVGVEVDATLVALANENAARNGMADRVRFTQADTLNLPPELRSDFSHVLCNPPFHGGDGEISPDPARARALADGSELKRWIEIGARRTISNGTFTMVLRADRTPEVLAVLPQRGVAVFPLWPNQRLAAKRVLIQLRRGSGTPFALYSGLVLHGADGLYTKDADAVLRDAAPLLFEPS